MTLTNMLDDLESYLHVCCQSGQLHFVIYSCGLVSDRNIDIHVSMRFSSNVRSREEIVLAIVFLSLNT